MIEGIDIRNAFAPAFTPSLVWRELSETERIAWVGRMVTENPSIRIISAKADGHVVVSITEQLSAAKRGDLFMRVEELCKEMVDTGITIWLEARQDRNALRNLRGVEVKRE